jgi:hypothetical protein
MTTSTRLSWLARLLAVVAAAGYLGWLLASASPPRAGPPGLAGSLHEEEMRERDLHAQKAVIRDRIDRKEHLIQDVIAGQKTLLEAAGPFYELHRQIEVRFPGALPLFPDLPKAERACRLVINRVQGLLAGEPARSKAVTERLEAEYQRHLREGTLQVSFPPQEEEEAR